MHTLLKNWSVDRSGAFVRVQGDDAEGNHTKFVAHEVAGPDPRRVTLPDRTIAWPKDNGQPVILI